MRWVLMLFVIVAAVLGGEARVVVVSGRAVVSERVGKGEAAAIELEALCGPSRDAAPGLEFQAAYAAGRSKEADPTGGLNEGYLTSGGSLPMKWPEWASIPCASQALGSLAQTAEKVVDLTVHLTKKAAGK
jgi:hypothetical protein